jgi:DNA-binding transcriptional ArsR family regulator
MQATNLLDMEANAAQAESLLSLLANRHRLMVVCHLTEGEMTVSQMLAVSTLSQSALSQHLAKLREAEMVKTRREGQLIYYSLASEQARKLIETLCSFYDADQSSP